MHAGEAILEDLDKILALHPHFGPANYAKAVIL